MSRNSLIAFRLPFAALSLVAMNCLANDRESWVERMKCGEVIYQIESRCKKSEDPFTLNDCDSQRLITTYRGQSRTTVLPQLEKSTLEGIRNSGRLLSDFFVTQWTCVTNDKQHMTALYYSVGGGTGSYADAVTVYDATGTFVRDNKSAATRSAITRISKFQRVKSIMPE